MRQMRAHDGGNRVKEEGSIVSRFAHVMACRREFHDTARKSTTLTRFGAFTSRREDLPSSSECLSWSALTWVST